MTDELTAVLDRFVADQRTALPALADVRGRAKQRRRRRLTITSTAVVLIALLTGGGLWAVRADREPGLLVVADGEVRLNDWVTLTWLPDDVVGAEFTGTNRLDAMETFGYWQGHYSIHRAGGSVIELSLTLGDQFDIGAEIATAVGPATVLADRVRVSLADGRFRVAARHTPFTVAAIGNDPDELVALIDGLVTSSSLSPLPLPGAPVLLTAGSIDGVPWDLRVTLPQRPITSADLDAGGACLVLRNYAEGYACLRRGVDWITVLPARLSRADDSVPLGPIWLVLTETPAVAFEYTLANGAVGRVEADPASPATGRFGVIDAGLEELTEVRALGADGSVLQTNDPDLPIMS